MNAPANPRPDAQHDTAVTGFLAAVAVHAREPGSELLLPEGWGEEDWRELFSHTGLRKVSAGEALIRRGDRDCTLFLVLSGTLEVVVHAGDGHSLGPLSRVRAGSVLGEQSFFDSEPRSASVWAVEPCVVAAMTPEQFRGLEQSQPALARDLLFALGRILAIRLRRTTARVGH